MKTIIFCKEGEAISDFAIQEKLDEFLESEVSTWFISTLMVIEEICARIAEGKIDKDAIKIQIQDLKGTIHETKIDDRGTIEKYFDSMETNSDILLRILKF